MGLDITSYRKLIPAPDAPREDGYVVDWEKFVDLDQSSLNWTEEHWPGHSDGIKAGAYTFAEKYPFRAGSYGGYNSWRRWLARVAGWEDIEECWNSSDQQSKPFGELLNFADNEGVNRPEGRRQTRQGFCGQRSARRNIVERPLGYRPVSQVAEGARNGRR